MGIDALHSVLHGMRRFSTRLDHAAARIANVGLEPLAASEADAVLPPEHAPRPAPDPLLDGMVDMLIAQRMFMANLRAAQAADEMLETATELTE